MLLFLPIMLCCSALEIHLLCSILCSRTRIFVRLFMVSIYKQFTTYIHVTESFIKTVLLECINEYWHIIMLNHTVTVLLEYNDRSLLFPTNA